MDQSGSEKLLFILDAPDSKHIYDKIFGGDPQRYHISATEQTEMLNKRTQQTQNVPVSGKKYH